MSKNKLLDDFDFEVVNLEKTNDQEKVNIQSFDGCGGCSLNCGCQCPAGCGSGCTNCAVPCRSHNAEDKEDNESISKDSFFHWGHAEKMAKPIVELKTNQVDVLEKTGESINKNLSDSEEELSSISVKNN